MIFLRMLLIFLAPQTMRKVFAFSPISIPLAHCRRRFIIAYDTTFSVGRCPPVLPSRIRRHSTKIGGERSTTSQTKENALPVSTVLLKRTKQSKAFRNGNQLVFTRAIKTILSQSSPPLVAELVRVAVEADHNPVVLGWGVYNPHSLYKVRFLCHRYLQPQLHRTVESILTTGSDTNEPTKLAIQTMVQHHVHVALETRQTALNLPTTLPNESVGMFETNTYRLLNGEGDGMSGLAIDVIGDVAVIMSSALWCEVHRDVIAEVVKNSLPNHEVVWKTAPSRLQQDGADQLSAHETEQWLLALQAPRENESKQILSKENGVVFATFPFADGQKTGVYCDQRENRYHVATLSRNKRVLDLCCYHGGFSLTAIVLGGASSAVGVDSSPDAIEICRLNSELNQCSDKVDFVRADIAAFLQDQYSQNERYDIVVLDPPKLAPSAKALDKARRKYHGLNRDAIKVVADAGGLLMTCSCSAAMTQMDGGQYFLNMVQGAALAAGRQITLLRVSGAASCHTQSPISFPASAYLTAALFYIHPLEK